MRVVVGILIAGAAACASPKTDAKDSATAAVQEGVDSMAAHAESGSHDSTSGLKPTPPIFERNQRDSLGRPLPRTPATLPTAKRDSTTPMPPGPPQMKVDTLVRKPPR